MGVFLCDFLIMNNEGKIIDKESSELKWKCVCVDVSSSYMESGCVIRKGKFFIVINISTRLC